MSETKTVWPYPQEKPLVKDNDKEEDYLVTIRYKKEKFVINASFSPYYKQFYQEYMISDLDKYNITHEDTISHFTNHGDVGKYFSPWIKARLTEI